jgi:hypothetical protein
VAAPHILIFGCPLERQDECRRELRAHARNIEPHFYDSRPTILDRGCIPASDAVVCIARTQSDEAWALDLVRQCAVQYPYIPVVVHSGPLKAEPFYDLRAFHALKGGLNLSTLARKISKAVFEESAEQLGISRVVVDNRGIIVKANTKALLEFNPSLSVGQPYRVGIEDASHPSLPPDHPIAEVLQTGLPVSRYCECLGQNQEWHRASLICTPVRNLSGEVRAVAILLRKVDRWSRVFAAVAALARAETPDKLYQAVVEEARKLGYPRARLKQLLPAESSPDVDRLYGRASVGLDAQRDRDYKAGYFIERQRDPLAFECLNKSLPLLFVPCTDTDHPRSDLVCLYSARHQEEIVGDEHARWIDAPIFETSR